MPIAEAIDIAISTSVRCSSVSSAISRASGGDHAQAGKESSRFLSGRFQKFGGRLQHFERPARSRAIRVASISASRTSCVTKMEVLSRSRAIRETASAIRGA